jgi:hypothetical protein
MHVRAGFVRTGDLGIEIEHAAAAAYLLDDEILWRVLDGAADTCGLGKVREHQEDIGKRGLNLQYRGYKKHKNEENETF